MTTLEVKTFLGTLQNQVAGESLEELFDMHRQMGVPGAVLSGFDAAHVALTSDSKGK